MDEQRKTLAEISSTALSLLSRELGVDDTIRFIERYRNEPEYSMGSGDYTAERDAWLGHLTLAEILGEIKESSPDATA